MGKNKLGRFNGLYTNARPRCWDLRDPCSVTYIKTSKTRNMSATKQLLVNANDGSDLDNTQEIADEFRGNPEGMERYFREKENSINMSHSETIRSAERGGLSQEALDRLHNEFIERLRDLSGQIDDAKDLASIYSNDSDVDESRSLVSSGNLDGTDTGGGAGTTDQVGGPDGADTGGEVDVEATQEDSYHPQDTSDIVPTDYNDFTFHEE